MIKVKNLYKKYQYPLEDKNVLMKIFFRSKLDLRKNEFYGLENINFSLEDNDKLFVFGKPNSGLWSLYGVLSEKLSIDHGTYIRNNSVISFEPRSLPKMMFPKFSLDKFLDVYIVLKFRNFSYSLSETKKKVYDLLEVSEKDKNTNFYELGNDLILKLNLVIANLSENKIFIFNDFIYNYENNNLFYNLINSFFQKKRNNICIFFRCRSMELVKKHATKIMLLENGRIIEFKGILKYSDEKLKDFINYSNVTEDNQEFEDFDN
jgi:ABC-type polysaccharide/polyol phosphate transport system ATPase subunit